MKGFMKETEKEKVVRSEDYNYNFDKATGYFERWGKTKDDDPEFSPVGPEILDLEISEICNQGCSFCYKSNVGFEGKNMTLETFKIILPKLPKTITQIAFGIGDIDGNPDLKEIILETRKAGIIPNITINGSGVTDEWVRFFSENLGAIAVSVYDKENSYNAVKKLTDAGMTQVNFHYMISESTYKGAKDIMDDIVTDSRLSELNAFVMLSLKKKGRGINHDGLSQEKFTELIEYAHEKGINYGMDSCGAFKYLKAIENDKDYKQKEMYVEPCESTCFSSYINVDGKFFPCSFTEGTEGWEDGIDVLKCDNFLKDVWFNERTKQVRNNIINCRNCKKNCFYYDV